MRVFLFMVFALCLLGFNAQAKAPSLSQMKYACEITKGKWEELPEWCDGMHPRTFKKLTAKQQRHCLDKFNEPCECGPKMRFSVYKVLGCIRSRFPEDRRRN